MARESNKVKTTNDIELKDRLVAINRTTKVTKGGRTFTFAAISVRLSINLFLCVIRLL